MGSAELHAHFYGPRKEDNSGATNSGAADSTTASGPSTTEPTQPRRHLLQVSTWQMAILMLFNTRDRLTFEVSILFWLSLFTFINIIVKKQTSGSLLLYELKKSIQFF